MTLVVTLVVTVAPVAPYKKIISKQVFMKNQQRRQCAGTVETTLFLHIFILFFQNNCYSAKNPSLYTY